MKGDPDAVTVCTETNRTTEKSDSQNIERFFQSIGVENQPLPRHLLEDPDQLTEFLLLKKIVCHFRGLPRRISQFSKISEPVILYSDSRAIGFLLPNDERGAKPEFLSFWKESPGLSSSQALKAALSIGAFCKKANSDVDTDEKDRNKSRHGHWFLSALRKSSRAFLGVIPASFLINGFALAMPLFIMNVYDRVVPNGAIETLWVLAIGVTLIFLFEAILRVSRGKLIDVLGKKTDLILSERIFSHLLHLDMNARPASASDLAVQARAYETVREFLSSVSLVAMVDLPFAWLIVGAIFYIAGPMVWIPITAILIIVLFLISLQPFLFRHSKNTHQANIRTQSLVGEAANGLETIKAHRSEENFHRKLHTQVRDSARIDMKLRGLHQLGSAVTTCVIHFSTIALIVYGTYLIADQTISMGAMIAAVMISSRGLAPLNQISQLLLRLQSTIAAYRSLNKTMQLPSEDLSAGLNVKLKSPEITLQEVTFTYQGQPISSLQDIGFTIKPGDRIGVIGKSGSGKTTLLRLLSGQLKPSNGLILLNRVDQQQISLNSIREYCSYLPQQGTVFLGTVRENIKIANPIATDEELIETAKAAGVTEWCNLHPFGLDREVGETGILLSGGQRQTILWARCLLQKPSLLLLDEPTSGLDMTAERQFSESLNHYLKESNSRTVVISTHKMHLLNLVSKLIVLEKGRIVAAGPRDEVIAKLNPRNKPEKKEQSTSQHQNLKEDGDE